jgi:hypothetical protein
MAMPYAISDIYNLYSGRFKRKIKFLLNIRFLMYKLGGENDTGQYIFTRNKTYQIRRGRGRGAVDFYLCIGGQA